MTPNKPKRRVTVRNAVTRENIRLIRAADKIIEDCAKLKWKIRAVLAQEVRRAFDVRENDIVRWKWNDRWVFAKVTQVEMQERATGEFVPRVWGVYSTANGTPKGSAIAKRAIPLADFEHFHRPIPPIKGARK